MKATELTLGDLVGTSNNPMVDAVVDRMLGKQQKPQPEEILVQTNGSFQWAKPVLADDEGRLMPVAKIA